MGVCAVVVPQIPLSKALTVIRKENDQCIIVAAARLYRGNDTGHLLVCKANSAGIERLEQDRISDVLDLLVLRKVLQ